MKRLIVLPALLAACIASGKSAGRLPVNASLEAGKAHEVCARLEKGDKRKYYWKATGPVDFNIHYHEGPEVFYPVKREAMRGDGGTFTARVSQDYCWMWTARKGPVTVTGQVLE